MAGPFENMCQDTCLVSHEVGSLHLIVDSSVMSSIFFYSRMFQADHSDCERLDRPYSGSTVQSSLIFRVESSRSRIKVAQECLTKHFVNK